MKKEKGLTIKINLSNRWIYFLITLGILAAIGVGVYAAVDTTKAWHSANQVDFTGGITIPSGDIVLSTGQLCFGTDCKSSWSASGTKGAGFYIVTNGYCTETVGVMTFSSTCTTKQCSGTTVPVYYKCNGNCPRWTEPGATQTSSCPNTLKGYLVN
jgi:hypothetical protein